MSEINQIVALISGNYIKSSDFEKASNFIDYLLEAGVSKTQILNLYENGWLCEYKELPDELWENSLLKPYTYYYHTKLRQLSPPCTFDSKTGAFVEHQSFNEMRIILTLEQVIADMYVIVGTLPEFQHTKRDIEGLRFALDKHKMAFVGDIKIETIDVIYMIFDKAALASYGPRSNFLELFNYAYINCLTTIEEMLITPQKSFMLRTGELVMCRGK